MTDTDTAADPGIRHLADVLDVGHALRDAPDEAFIERMRNRYPTEREFDRMLTRKARQRNLPRRTTTTLEDFAACLDAFLRDHVQSDFAVSRLRWMSGGGSKIQLAFALDWNDPEAGRTTTDMVIRMEPQESLNATSRLRESQLLRAFAGTLPVPRVYWVDDEGRWFPEPSLIYAFARGVSKPTAIEGRPGGVEIGRASCRERV